MSNRRRLAFLLGLVSFFVMLAGCSAVSKRFLASAPKTDSLLTHWYPAKPLEATGVVRSRDNNFHLKVLCDGQGCLRIDTTQAKLKIASSTIYNFLTDEVFVLDHKFKTVLLKKGAVEALRLVLDDKSARYWQAQSLGTKLLDGYLCKGWRYADPETQSQNEVWLADNLGWYVLFNSRGASKSSISIHMRHFSHKKPTAEAFTLPANYTVQELPAKDDREI